MNKWAIRRAEESTEKHMLVWLGLYIDESVHPGTTRRVIQGIKDRVGEREY